MEQILKNGNLITYRNCEYTLNGYEVVDDQCIHLYLDEGIYAIVLPCILNEKIIDTIEQFEEEFK